MNGLEDKPFLGLTPLGMAPLDCPPDPAQDDAPC